MGLIKRLFVLVILLVAAYRIDVLERQVAELKARPAIIYHADNAGGAMIGKVTGKAIRGRQIHTRLRCVWKVFGDQGAVRVSKFWG